MKPVSDPSPPPYLRVVFLLLSAVIVAASHAPLAFMAARLSPDRVTGPLSLGAPFLRAPRIAARRPPFLE